MNKSKEVASEFVITSSETAKLFNATEKALDDIAAAILQTIESAPVAPMGAWRNGRLCAARFDLLDERLAIVAFVGDNTLTIHCGDQGHASARVRAPFVSLGPPLTMPQSICVAL